MFSTKICNAGLAVFLTLAAFAVPAAAQDRVIPANPDQLRLSYAPVVRRVTPAVVNVYAARQVTVRNNPLFDDPLFRRFFGGPNGPGGQQQQQMQRALGSGVIVDS